IEGLNPPPPVLVFSASEIGADEKGRVSSALVKSQTTNDELIRVLHSLVWRSKTQMKMRAKAARRAGGNHRDE
ncbi:MAG: hypothetical protein OEV31_09015, partial [Gammaproteobacteria bacterium]|nr:hypothetical protein [Gammaproteobacteria bacterium]